MRAPSTKTRVWVELVPRVKSDVWEPGVPAWTTSRPGTVRKRSETAGASRLSIS